MIDVIRVALPDRIKRFPMFTSNDHLSFLMSSSDMMNGKTLTEQQVILDEILDLLYPNYSKTEQEYIFTKVYCSSFGRDAIKIGLKQGDGVVEAFMHIHNIALENEYKVDESITLGFRFPRNRKRDASVFIECIDYIINEGTRYEWASLDDETKEDITDLVDMEDIKKIIAMLTRSCEVTIKKDKFHDLLTLFKIIFSPSELQEFFKTNYLMNKNNLQIDTLMTRSPMERSIYAALLTEDLKRRENANT